MYSAFQRKTPCKPNGLKGVIPWDASILNVEFYYATSQGKIQFTEGGIFMISIFKTQKFSYKEGILHVKGKLYP